MTTDPLDLSERIISGAASIEDHHPVTIGGEARLHEMDTGVGFVESFGNVTALDGGGRLALIDAGGVLAAGAVHAEVRRWTDSPLEVAIYTHGHVDHVFAVPIFEAEEREVRPTVIAHHNVPRRFDRYQLTNGYNGTINQRQFGLPEPMFPDRFRYPDRTYDHELEITAADTPIELRHDKGETDDGTWAWIPDRSLLCTGDLFIWASPNCGNPQKVQRFPWEWATALRRMADLGAELMLPGHGLPIAGRDTIRRVLSDTAELLESLVDQTLELMNAGARLDEAIHTVTVPAHLRDTPWLQPVYDDPEFVVRNLWRLYGGWWDGNPATLRPAPEDALAREVAALAGGATALVDRAEELSEAGDHRLAGHLIEFAVLSAPDDADLHRRRVAIYSARMAEERCLMARGVYRSERTGSERAVEAADGPDPS